jgi:hypothetical protein
VSTLGLSPVAGYVYRSLHDHPDLRLPDAIAAGPAVDGAIDSDAVRDGLGELRSRGLAEEEGGAGWRLTDAATAG